VLLAIALNNGAKIHFDPARYGAELQLPAIIFDIPSYKKCHPMAILMMVKIQVVTWLMSVLDFTFILYQLIGLKINESV
jgi:hypothetical protein